MTDSIKLADYILIPTETIHNLIFWACKDSIELVQARMQIDDKLKAGLVISQTNKADKFSKEVIEFINENFEIPLLRVVRRYASAMQKS